MVLVLNADIGNRQIEIFPPMAYYNSNRTPHTSHASDVSHGETFFYTEKRELDIERTKDF